MACPELVELILLPTPMPLLLSLVTVNVSVTVCCWVTLFVRQVYRVQAIVCTSPENNH